jgi:hypothetical protein
MLICLPYLIYKRGHKGIRPTGVNRASPVVLSESPETFQIRPRHGGYIYLVLLIGLLYFQHRRGYFLLDALSLSHLCSSSLGVFGDLLFAPFAQAYALCLGMQPLGWGLRHGREGYLAVGMDE